VPSRRARSSPTSPTTCRPPPPPRRRPAGAPQEAPADPGPPPPLAGAGLRARWAARARGTIGHDGNATEQHGSPVAGRRHRGRASADVTPPARLPCGAARAADGGARTAVLRRPPSSPSATSSRCRGSVDGRVGEETYRRCPRPLVAGRPAAAGTTPSPDARATTSPRSRSGCSSSLRRRPGRRRLRPGDRGRAAGLPARLRPDLRRHLRAGHPPRAAAARPQGHRRAAAAAAAERQLRRRAART
jgi:hypothetical protein